MPNQAKIAEAIEASRSQLGFAINAGPTIVDVVARFDARSATMWADAMGSFATSPGVEVRCFDEFGETVEPGSVLGQSDDGRLQFQVRSPQFDHAAHVVCLEQFRTVLRDAAGSKGTIRVAGLAEGFRTPSLVVEPWTSAPSDGPPRGGSPQQNARRVVRSLDRAWVAPDDVSRWLASDLPDTDDRVVEEFKERAVDLLLRSIVSELYTEDDVRRCILASTPARRLFFGPDVIPDAREFADLVAACDWIYMQGADVEVRHALFVNELGREWPEGTEFRTGVWSRLARSLDATKLVYRAHLQAGSKDTLKSLTDLRKTLGDEIQKLMQQTRDLSTSLWRDVAIAIGVTALRFGLDPAKIAAAGSVYATVFVACAVYLVVSLVLTTRTNKAFLNVVNRTRASWRTKLYGYLDESDYEKLADAPLREAEAVYRRTVRWAWTIVLIVAGLLLWMAAVEAGLAPHGTGSEPDRMPPSTTADASG